uniref:Uncharacterized protein n=1 Tax=Anguilla anguilla TaxID=7936 RepID=A0A0E9VF30_ANGAN
MHVVMLSEINSDRFLYVTPLIREIPIVPWQQKLVFRLQKQCMVNSTVTDWRSKVHYYIANVSFKNTF